MRLSFSRYLTRCNCARNVAISMSFYFSCTLLCNTCKGMFNKQFFCSLRCALREKITSSKKSLVSSVLTVPLSGKLTQCVFGHKDVVTCLAYSCHVGLTGCHGGIVVSGSRDATLLVWQWSERAQGVVSPDQSTGELFTT